ncbi:MAG TPA: FHA domain-containing protein [Baekduia sp.]|nr:FHA domain-containing protein [Baekduia sp.]
MDEPYLQFRDDRDRLRVHRFQPGIGRVTIGRSAEADVALPWDDRVSRQHARLELVGEDRVADWTVVDDGPSRNGTFVNGERVRGRARLAPGDTLSVGSTALLFRVPLTGDEGGEDPTTTTMRPERPPPETTILARRPVTRASLSDSQRRVLAALAAPGDGPLPTDQQIAGRLFLAVATVTRHVHELAVLYGVADLPPDEQRRRIVQLARGSGLVAPT